MVKLVKRTDWRKYDQCSRARTHTYYGFFTYHYLATPAHGTVRQGLPVLPPQERLRKIASSLWLWIVHSMMAYIHKFCVSCPTNTYPVEPTFTTVVHQSLWLIFVHADLAFDWKIAWIGIKVNMGGTVSKTTTSASSGEKVRGGSKKGQRKKSNRRRFDASKVKKTSVKRGSSASGSISKKAIEATVTEKGHRKVSQKRPKATTVTLIDSGQGSSGVGSPGSGTGDSLNDESDDNNQFLQPSTALTKKKAATTKSPPHHKDSNHRHHGRAASTKRFQIAKTRRK